MYYIVTEIILFFYMASAIDYALYFGWSKYLALYVAKHSFLIDMILLSVSSVIITIIIVISVVLHSINTNNKNLSNALKTE